MDEYFDHLGSIAAIMNSLRYDESAELKYDMMADALWWCEERPSFKNAKDHWCLRPVFNYRTSVMIGSPATEWEPFWLRAQHLFPAWPGFHASRTTRTREMLAFYRQHSKAAFDSVLDAFDD